MKTLLLRGKKILLTDHVESFIKMHTDEAKWLLKHSHEFFEIPVLAKIFRDEARIHLSCALFYKRCEAKG